MEHIDTNTHTYNGKILEKKLQLENIYFFIVEQTTSKQQMFAEQTFKEREKKNAQYVFVGC